SGALSMPPQGSSRLRLPKIIRIPYENGIYNSMSAVDQNLVANLEESFLLFIESVPDAMVLSNREGQIVLVNVNTEKLFGYHRDELLGKKVEILLGFAPAIADTVPLTTPIRV